MNNISAENTFAYYEANSIELLGYAKNDISEAEAKSSDMPIKYKKQLRFVKEILTEVQEYLFNN